MCVMEAFLEFYATFLGKKTQWADVLKVNSEL